MTNAWHQTLTGGLRDLLVKIKNLAILNLVRLGPTIAKFSINILHFD
jgi:hypothetical protein